MSSPLRLALSTIPGEALGADLPVASAAPFVLLLLCIAVLPLCAGSWWEHNKNKALVAALLALPFGIWLVLSHGAPGGHALFEASLDYISFIALLGALYVISGGIHIKGSLAGTPLSNAGLLAIGAVLANFIGTTGASMVLIRPLLRANHARQRKAHLVVFFIFIVSNCGGLLTPLGDPPLFLGFLKGVPFEWTLSLWSPWLVVNGALLVVFQLVDSYVIDQEEAERPGSQLERVLHHKKFAIEGGRNVLLLVGVIVVIIAKGQGWGAPNGSWPFGIQESAMIGLAIASYTGTSREIHGANHFTFGPILEVALLFGGIFVTMVAPLAILNARGAELGLSTPWQYYWASGLLSSFLDNAPTYLTFAATASGQMGVSASGPHYLAEMLAKGPQAGALLTAIACGSVMMGANTYIGNGPNFMVKAIAEQHGIKMPSFFGYMGWSITILIPIFIGVTFLFFR